MKCHNIHGTKRFNKVRSKANLGFSAENPLKRMLSSCSTISKKRSSTATKGGAEESTASQAIIW